MNKLFAVYLGGTAPKANTELHDVVFAVGVCIEDTYEQLMEQWFGILDGLHIDSWIELSVIDGHRVTIQEKPSESTAKLFFINMGAYAPGQFLEVHSNEFYVAENKVAVTKRAREGLLKGKLLLHRDYLYDIDECLEIEKIGRHYVHLSPTMEVVPFEPVNAYHRIPKARLEAFANRTKVSPE